MAGNDIVTFAIDGELSLERFAQAVRRFTDLIRALNTDLGQGADIRWVLSGLEYGSAIAIARGVPRKDEDAATVERIVDAYLTVGTALEANTPIPFSERVEDRALRVRQLLNHSHTDIESIRFETPKDDVTIERAPSPEPLPAEARAQAYGAVEGRVQTLSSRGTLHFTLYDTLHDKAVSCYLEAGRESLMKDVWGRLAVVEGWVKRDRKTGQPRTVRFVRNVTILPEPTSRPYLDARGAWPREPTDLRAEDAIG